MEKNKIEDSTNKFDHHCVGGTMYFYNEDQSISGEITRHNNFGRHVPNVWIELDKGSEPLNEEEELLLMKIFRGSEAYDR
jgi:hypothetical protein